MSTFYVKQLDKDERVGLLKLVTEYEVKTLISTTNNLDGLECTFLTTDDEVKRVIISDFMGKDLPKNKDWYYFMLTRFGDAWLNDYEQVILGQTPKKKVLYDKGKWYVSDDAVLYSDDFNHDVMLKIYGDFGGLNEKKAYANTLCRLLNNNILWGYADVDKTVL